MASLRFLFLFAILGALALRAQTTLPVFSYSYTSTQPDDRYPDPGNVKLTDGVAVVPSWGAFGNLDTSPFVGFNYSDIVELRIRFVFDTPVILQEASFYFAQTDYNAGVRFPSQLAVYQDGESPTFFSVTAPPGTGSSAPYTYTFALGGLQTDHLILGINPAGEWTMMTEATFTGSAVPEPSTYAAIVGGLALAAALWHRRRAARPSV